MFTHYTGNRQFDLQLNRSLGPILDRPGMDRLTTSVLPRIRSTRQITQLAERLAVRFDSAGDAAAAWRLYSLAAFYLPEHDPRKCRFIDAMSREFDASHAHLALSRHTIPYGDAALTAIRWEADSADRSRFPEAPATLVMMNGFDGYAEEIMGFAEHFSSRPFDIITFDGPGQGAHGAGRDASGASLGAPNERDPGLLRPDERGGPGAILRGLPGDASRSPRSAHQPRRCLRHDVPTAGRADDASARAYPPARGLDS